MKSFNYFRKNLFNLYIYCYMLFSFQRTNERFNLSKLNKKYIEELMNVKMYKIFISLERR